MTPPTKKTARHGGISDGAVKKATGKSWAQWCKLLDAAGAKNMPHKEIAAWLYEKHGKIGGWWCQMVTVGYEQARGLRQVHEKPGGFEIGRSRTIAAPLGKLYAAWQTPKARAAWLADPGVQVRTATRNKSMRLDWVDGKTRLSVNFYDKGSGKSQVAVQHMKLKTAREAERMKKYWSAQLDALQAHLQR